MTGREVGLDSRILGLAAEAALSVPGAGVLVLGHGTCSHRLAGGPAPQGALSPGGGRFWEGGLWGSNHVPPPFQHLHGASLFFTFSPFYPNFAFLKSRPSILFHPTLHSPRPAPGERTSGLGL